MLSLRDALRLFRPPADGLQRPPRDGRPGDRGGRGGKGSGRGGRGRGKGGRGPNFENKFVFNEDDFPKLGE